MKLVGAHVIGEQATEIVHLAVVALLVEADVDLFIQACFNYPTLTELYKYAAYSALDARARALRRRHGRVTGLDAVIEALE